MNLNKRLERLEQGKGGNVPIAVFLDCQEGETEDQAKARISKEYPATQVIVWLSNYDLTI